LGSGGGNCGPCGVAGGRVALGDGVRWRQQRLAFAIEQPPARGIHPGLARTNTSWHLLPQPAVRIRAVKCAPTSNTIDVGGLRVHKAEALLEEKLRSANGPLWATLRYLERVADAERDDGHSAAAWCG
jgi:hypothetical protein